MQQSLCVRVDDPWATSWQLTRLKPPSLILLFMKQSSFSMLYIQTWCHNPSMSHPPDAGQNPLIHKLVNMAWHEQGSFPFSFSHFLLNRISTNCKHCHLPVHDVVFMAVIHGHHYLSEHVASFILLKQ